MIAEPPIAKKQWTYEEVAQFDNEARFEIHDGELFEMPSPNLNHQRIIFRLATFLAEWAKTNGGEPFVSPIDLYVSSTKYYIPDLVFYTRESLNNPAVLADPQRLRVAPDLVVEVASPSTARNDRVEKVRAYAEFGVQNYWIVDPESQTLWDLELRENVYFLVAAHDVDETFSSTNFAGLTIELRAIFGL